jgi:hypothetical protein
VICTLVSAAAIAAGCLSQQIVLRMVSNDGLLFPSIFIMIGDKINAAVS